MIRQKMQIENTRKGWLYLAAGFISSSVLCSTIALGALQFSGVLDADRMQSLETKLHALAALRSDTMAIATGPIEEGIEGIFVLDNISGNLSCGVFNPRNGRIAGSFQRNISQDLGTEQGKQPKYLLVTGYFDIQNKIGNTRPAKSLVYVADSNSGRYAAYMLPWNAQLTNQNLAQVQPIVLIGVSSARNLQPE